MFYYSVVQIKEVRIIFTLIRFEIRNDFTNVPKNYSIYKVQLIRIKKR